MSAGRRLHSFPKKLRLLKRNEFRRVYQEGRRRSASLCVVFSLSNGLARSRLGVTVPAAVGSAVLRNKVKRRVREVFRLNQHSIPLGWDIVVNPRRDAAKVPFTTLTRELLRLFPRQAAPLPTMPKALESSNSASPPEVC